MPETLEKEAEAAEETHPILDGQEAQEAQEGSAAEETPPEETPEPAAEETPEPAAEPARPSFMEQLSGLGFENLESDADAQARVLEAYQQQQQSYEELQAQQDQLKQRISDAEYRASLSTVNQPEPAKEAGDKQFWDPPPYDPSCEEYRQVDPATGKTTWKDGTPVSVREGAEKVEAFRTKWANTIINRPHEVFPEMIAHYAKPLIEQEVERRISEDRSQRSLEQIQRDNEWMFQVDPVTGLHTKQFSNEGQKVIDIGNRIKGIDFNDDANVLKAAMDFYQDNKTQQSSQAETATEQARQTRQQKQRSHMRKAVGSPGRGGSIPNEDDQDPRPQNSNLSAGRQLLAAYEEAGG